MTMQDPAADPFAERERRRLRAAISVIRSDDPDREARVQQRARATGVSATSLRVLPDEEWPSDPGEMRAADRLLVEAPRTALSMTDLNFGRLAHDDVENLASVERAVAPRQDQIDYYRRASGGATLQEIPRGRGPGAWLRGLWTSFTTTGDVITSSLEMQAGDFLEGLGLIEQERVRGRTRAEDRMEGVRFRRDVARPELEGNIASGVYSGLESASTMLPALAASVLARNPAPALAAAGLTTQTEAYGRYRGRGASAGEAFLGAGGEAAVEIATELLPVGKLIEALGGEAVFKNLAISLGTDILGEQAATLAQDAIDTAIANPDKTWADYLAERPDAAAQTLVASLVQQAIFSSPGAVIGVLERNRREQAAAEAGETDAAAIENLIALSEASKLRERSPVDFADFVQQASEGGPLENVYIKADVFAQAAASAGVELDAVLQAMPYLREQMPTALATGGDLRIDAGDFAAYIAPQTFAQSLIPNLKANPFGVSRAEAETFVAEQGQRLKEDVERAVQSGQIDAQQLRSVEVVRERMVSELERAGRFTSDVNTAYADLVTNFYAATAARLGITAEEMADRYPLRVMSEAPRSASAVLEQDQELDLVHFGRDPGMTRTDPSRWGENRFATSREEAARKQLGAPGRTYFGIRGQYQTERVIQQTAAFEFNARVPAARVYDFDADPQGLRPEGPRNAENASAYERAIQEAGFSGYRTAQMGGVVAMFDPVDVGITGAVRSYEDRNAVRALSEKLAQADRKARLATAAPDESVYTRSPEEFREQAIAQLFPDRVFGQREITPEQAEERARRLAEQIPGLKAQLPYLTTDEKAKLRRDTAEKITRLIEEFPDAEEMAAVAYAGRAKRGWYENSAQAILSIFGAKDAPRFAALLAALSPQTSVESNTYNALATWTNWINAGRPTARRDIVEIMAKSVQGKGTTESVLNAWINNSVTALSAENPADITLSGPKVNSFMLNLIGVVDEVTNDSWMASYALVEQSVFKKTGAVPGKGPGYMAMSAVVRRAAEIASERTGEDWTPAEIQETVWSWAKALYEKRDAAGERRPAQVIAATDLTAEDIASTPDFAVLFVDGVYRRILEAGGYGAELEALDARGQPARRDATGGDPRSAEGSGVDEAQFFRYVDQAAARLEELRVRRNEGAPADDRQLSLFAQGPVEAPLAGQPQTVNIPDRGRVVFGPHAPSRQAARDYMAERGLRYEPPTEYAKVDVERAQRIAQAFDDMKHDPSDPLVAASYRAMIDETLAQYQAIKATGLKIEFIDFAKQGDPYAATPRLAILDVIENNHLWVFPTDDGFGSSDLDVSDNPLLEMTDEYIDGRQLRANDVFRIVHDYFGHIKDGFGFRADGEENAWQSHAAMYTPLARRAMTTETRGQNSWVNYGPHGEKNRKASAGETVYADQKIGLLPEWVSTEGFLGGAQTGEPLVATFNQSQPVFYSGLLRAVETQGPERATPAEWLAWLIEPAYTKRGVKRDDNNRPMLGEDGQPVIEEREIPARARQGLKLEEIEWTGLEAWLKGLAAGQEFKTDGLGTELSEWVASGSVVDAQGNISRESVAEFLRAGGVQVEEVLLGDEPPVSADLDPYYLEREVERLMRDDETLTRTLAEMRVRDEWDDLNNTTFEDLNPESTARFSGYKLPGADDTYRELLFRLPALKGPSTHWEEESVVAHTRFTERRDAEGARVLFLEELQSDWHQKGRDEGYQRIASAEERAAAEQALEYARQALVAAELASLPVAERVINERLAFYEAKLAELKAAGVAALAEQDLRDVDRPEDRAAVQEYRRIERQISLTEDLLSDVDPSSSERLRRNAVRVAFDAPGWGPNVGLPMPTDEERRASGHIAARLRYDEAQIAFDALDGGGIPDAPFRTSWSTMVMKRMIRWAVDNGYDKVAWINGNQQNGGQTGGDGSFFYERNLVNDTNKLLKQYGVQVEKIDMRDEQGRRRAEISEARLIRTQQALETETDPGARASILSEAQYQSDELAFQNRPARSLGIQNGFVLNDKLRSAALQGFSLFQENRGQIAFGADITQTPSVISLLKTADLSTFLHETGHFFLEVTAHIARQPDAPAEVVQDMGAILSWFQPGMTLEQWDALPLEAKRPYHEQFARGFEAYLFEGKAPSFSLRDLFRRFSAWMKNVYRSLTALDVELTDEVRSVLGRMVASAEDVAATEQARAFAPLFTSRPEGMTDFEWEEYQRLGVEATQTAVEDLERRSLRDMQWASGARSRALRDLQRQSAEQRKSVREEVSAEVMAEPVNRARQFLRRGVGDDGEPVPGARKLDLGTLKTLYGDDGEWTKLRRGGKYGEVANDGMHPDLVAEMFGFPSGEAMIAEMVNGENARDKIEGMTDQRMLERYGDLSSVEAIERAADEAVANDARAKFVAAEMAALDKAIGKRSILNEAARDYAAGVVNRTIMNRLRPAQYIAAAQRAAKEAETAIRKDDLVAAATAKRNQLINLQVAREVQKAQREAEKAMRLFKRIVTAKNDAVARTRNMDMVNAARAILSAYGLGRAKDDPSAYMEALKRYDPTLYADLEPFVQGARGQAKPLHEITYEQFQAMRDTVAQLWVMSRRVRQIEIDGEFRDREAVIQELGARLDEIGFNPAEAGVTRAATDKELFARKLAGARASLRRVESWARGVDGSDNGPFRRYIWNPISTAADRYRAETRDYILRFRDLVQTVEDRLKPVKIAAPEIGYTFGGKAELYHALLHTGNQSNKSKLLLGRGWGSRTADGFVDDSRWAAFIDRMHAEGQLDERDWTFVQAVWDLLEGTKPGAQRAHRQIYGRYFDEVAADPVETPFGTFRGGYVPALTDAFLVQDAVLRAEQEAIEGGDSAMFPAASNGFTKSRVEDYTRELALDLRLLPAHIDKVLLFTHLGPPVRDVARLLKDRKFSKTLQAFDPVAQTDLLLPWLQRAAKQIVETPTRGQGGKLIDNVFRALRARTGMQLMFANVLNTMQQVTGFSGVLLRVKPSYMGAALWRFMRDPAGVTEQVASLSTFMANRQKSDMFEARQVIEQLVRLNPSKLDDVRAFFSRHAYFLQTTLQNAMDAISWPAAYDQALARGDSPRDAARFADSVIRETQGTMSPEDISRFETGTPFVRMFTQFAGYFNMLANLNATEAQIVAREVGVRKGAGRLLYVYLLGFAVPALLGEAIAVAMRGSWEDDEEDGYLDELLEFFLLGQAKFALAAAPGVGQAANAAIGATTDAPYDDRISLSPAVSSVEAAVGVPAEVYQSIFEGEKWSRTDTRDAFTLLGLISGLPLGALGRPTGYAVGVATGDVEPTGPVDAARGAITGTPSAASRE